MNSNFILLGCLGGIIPDVLRLLKLGDDNNYKAPDYLKKGFFYVILILQIFFGGLMVYILPVHDKLQALVYGYAAPQIFTSLAAGIIRRAGGSQTPVKKAATEFKKTQNLHPTQLNLTEAVNDFY